MPSSSSAWKVDTRWKHVITIFLYTKDHPVSANFTILVSLSADISGLLKSQPLPRSAVHADVNLMEAAKQDAPHAANNAIVVTALAGSVAATLVVVAVLLIRRRERKMQQRDEAVIMQDVPGFMEVSVT